MVLIETRAHQEVFPLKLNSIEGLNLLNYLISLVSQLVNRVHLTTIIESAITLQFVNRNINKISTKTVHYTNKFCNIHFFDYSLSPPVY